MPPHTDSMGENGPRMKRFAVVTALVLSLASSACSGREALPDLASLRLDSVTVVGCSNVNQSVVIDIRIEMDLNEVADRVASRLREAALEIDGAVVVLLRGEQELEEPFAYKFETTSVDQDSLEARLSFTLEAGLSVTGLDAPLTLTAPVSFDEVRLEDMKLRFDGLGASVASDSLEGLKGESLRGPLGSVEVTAVTRGGGGQATIELTPRTGRQPPELAFQGAASVLLQSGSRTISPDGTTGPSFSTLPTEYHFEDPLAGGVKLEVDGWLLVAKAPIRLQLDCES